MNYQGDFNQKQGDPFDNYNNHGGGYHTVPNSVTVLVLGIISIVLCWCYGLVSIILGIIAIVLANQAERVYRANPQQFSNASYKNLRAGKICGIIGLCLGIAYLIFTIVYLSFVFGNLDKITEFYKIGK
jgi:hypothetical protein